MSVARQGGRRRWQARGRASRGRSSSRQPTAALDKGQRWGSGGLSASPWVPPGPAYSLSTPPKGPPEARRPQGRAATGTGCAAACPAPPPAAAAAAAPPRRRGFWNGGTAGHGWGRGEGSVKSGLIRGQVGSAGEWHRPRTPSAQHLRAFERPACAASGRCPPLPPRPATNQPAQSPSALGDQPRLLPSGAAQRAPRAAAQQTAEAQ